MPEFIADTDGTVTGKEWQDLSPFVQGYIEAMLFTETSTISMLDWNDEESKEAIEEGQADGNIPGDAAFGDIYPGSLESIIADCEAFQKAAGGLLAQAYGHTFPARTIGDGSLPDSHRPAYDYDEAGAGRDFWYTRNGHGVGFWDRDLGEVGDKLSALCGWEARDTTGLTEVYVSFGEAADGTESPTGYGFVFVQ